ncbi:YihY/virulence factor BrkB family protein [Streptomyces sp. NPDC060194]|uniref:YihY/virulence factor BrkB family protein n=1 Tax=Streptomyces sp. NPDC060194 TaxID=3347069 RepID=UPI00364EACF7
MDDDNHRDPSAATARDSRAEPPVDKPSALSKPSKKGALRRTVKGFKTDDLSDSAAALTYYAILAIFPAMLALVSILGLISKDAAQSLVDNIGGLAPGTVQDILSSMVTQLQSSGGKALIALIVGVALALWSASGYVAAFMRASNHVYGIGEGRPVWKTLPTRFGITVAVVLVLAVAAVGVVVSGPLAKKVGGILGLSDTFVTVWNIAKWPVIALLVALVFALLYWAAPNVKRGFSWVFRGAVLAVVIWLVASGLFAVYVANFSSYNKTYGTFAGIIIFLVWLWISNIALLLGLEYNSELERGRALEAGHPRDEEPYSEPRDTRKL